MHDSGPLADPGAAANPMPEIVGRLAAVADELDQLGGRDGRALACRLKRRLKAIADDGSRPTNQGPACDRAVRAGVGRPPLFGGAARLG